MVITLKIQGDLDKLELTASTVQMFKKASDAYHNTADQVVDLLITP